MRRALSSALLLAALGAVASGAGRAEGAEVATAVPVAAEAPPGAPPMSPRDAALIPLQAEVMLLVELGALAPPLPARVVAVHDEWASYAAGLPRAMLVDWLRQADTDGAAAVLAEGAPGAAIEQALRPLGAADLDTALAGGQVTVPATAYDQALTALAAPDAPTTTAPAATTVPVVVTSRAPTATTATRAVAAAATVPASTPATIAPASTDPAPSTAPAPTTATTATATTTTAAASTAGATTVAVTAAASSPVAATTPAAATTAAPAAPDAPTRPVSGAMAGLGAALALGVTGLGWMLTRRSIAAHGAARPATVDDVLDAGRRLTAAGDRAEVVRVAVAEAVDLARADAGVFVERAADGSLHVLAPHPLLPADLTRGPIPRALSSGLTDRSHRPGRALLVVPVVHDGSVLGALAVVRAAAPFAAPEQDLVARLAPLVAGALYAASRHEEGAELAFLDALTAVGNRRRFERDLDALAAEDQSLVVAMVDVDHFKAFNDRHGHQRGDDALRLVADTLRACVRRRDLVYRYGGEEFSILLPGATTADAAVVAERVRDSLARAVPPCGEGDGCRLTVSIGVAARTDADPRAAVARADEALYEAKRTGRDRVVVADPAP